MFKLKTKISGFTLLETMVSMIVLMIVFSLSTLLINNISSSGMTREKQNAHLFVKKIRNETISQQKYFDEIIEFDNLTLTKTITPYSKGDNLHVLLITITKGAKIIEESRNIIIINSEK